MKTLLTVSPRLTIPVLLSALFVGFCLPGCGKPDAAPTNESAESEALPTDLSTGAGAGASQPAAAAVAASQGTAEEILARMIEAYKNAKSYGDEAVVRVTGIKDGERQQMAFPHAVVFQRPNKIRMQIDNGTLLCDGVNTYGFSRELPGQVLKIPAPETLTIRSLYPDFLLAESMRQSPTQSFSWVPLQVVLLLAEDPMKTLALNAEEINLLEPAAIGQFACDRVELATGNGPGVLWIDQATSVLRRFELPIDALRREAEAQQFGDPTLSVEFQKAKLNPNIGPAAFQFQTPEEVETTDTLVMPLLRILGQPCPDFEFTDAEGNTTSLNSLRGKVVVIQLWTSKSIPCRPVLQAADKAYDISNEPDDVVMMAVNIEGPNVQNDSLQSVLQDWKVDLPLYRDPQQTVFQHFGINVAPVTIILDKEGNIQSFQPGGVDNMDALLARVIQRVQAGGDVYKSAFAQFEEQQSRFQMMVEQSVANDVYCFQPLIPRAEIKPRSEPSNLKMTELWSCDQVKQPGNITVVPGDDGSPRILVVDGAKSVVELQPDGAVAATHELELEGNEVVTVLRTATDGAGKRYFLGTARGVQRVHLFDDSLKTILVYPDVQHPGIADGQLADLTGDGAPEMVLGYGGAAGVHAVDVEGQRLWNNNSMVDPLCVAAVRPGAGGLPNILAMNGASGGGTIVELDSEGNRVGEISVPDYSVGWVVTDDLSGDGNSEICILAMAMDAEGRPAADAIDVLGIDREGKVLWKQSVVRGVHRQFVEPVVSGKVLPGEAGQWLIAAADGTIVVVNADGSLVERFAYGAELSGLATVQWDGRRVLLVSTPAGVDAWEVQAEAERSE